MSEVIQFSYFFLPTLFRLCTIEHWPPGYAYRFSFSRIPNKGTKNFS